MVCFPYTLWGRNDVLLVSKYSHAESKMFNWERWFLAEKFRHGQEVAMLLGLWGIRDCE